MAMMRQELRVRQEQALLLTLEMRQSIQILELPIGDLEEWLDEQIALNPTVERSEKRVFIPNEQADQPSLFQTLMKQARLELPPKEIEIAEWIIGNLDERGFYTLPLEEEQRSILEKIQELGPTGIAARNLQECLLLQLKGKEFATRLIRDHFDDLLHNRLQKIAQKMDCTLSQLKKSVKSEILRLDFYPAARYTKQRLSLYIPDIIIDKAGDDWLVVVDEPELCLVSNNLNTMSPQERALYLRQLQKGKGLIEALSKRRATLRKIAYILIEKMPAFFSGDVTYPQPLTMKEIASELGLHESTIARAVSGKALYCIQGMVPLRKFFTASLQNSEGQSISNEQAKQLLLQLIHQENKAIPLTDDALASSLRELGIPCARRTVAKYRQLLKIPSAFQRKRWSESASNEATGPF